MNKKSIVTLTSAESKRLIAKYVVRMPVVRQAMDRGIVDLQMSTTNGYIYEELTGNVINRAAYLCGFLSDTGGCCAYLPAANKREFYFENGVEHHLNFPSGSFESVYERMGAEDVLIKSGNLLDRNGNAGVFVGEPSGDGGEWGKASKYVARNRIQVIVPMTLNKSAGVDVQRVLEMVNTGELDWDRTHVIAEYALLPGIVVTEIDAVVGLSGANAMVVAMNGVSGGEGTVTLCIYGESQNVEAAWDLITSIKGEPELRVIPRCGKCMAKENNGICVAQQRVYTRG